MSRPCMFPRRAKTWRTQLERAKRSYWPHPSGVRCSKSSSIDRVDVTIVTNLVLCRHPLMSVYFLSCDIDERLFLSWTFQRCTGLFVYNLISLIRLEKFFPCLFFPPQFSCCELSVLRQYSNIYCVNCPRKLIVGSNPETECGLASIVWK